MSYEDLDVWKRTCRLSCNIYQVLRDCRDFSFRDQITRSGLSIPSNIAEGYERGSAKERKQFLFYAKGSAAELNTQIYIGLKVGFIPAEVATEWLGEVKQVKKILGALIQRCD